jgi:hypothetical protein
MSTTLDMTDVPAVPAPALARAMRILIDDGKGLVLLRGLPAADMRALEAAVWDELEGALAERRAVLVRFQALVDVFASRRLQSLMLRRGFPLIAPALHLAAQMRLNIGRGFSPTTFTYALHSLLAETDQSRPVAAVPAMDLAA